MEAGATRRGDEHRRCDLRPGSRGVAVSSSSDFTFIRPILCAVLPLAEEVEEKAGTLIGPPTTVGLFASRNLPTAQDSNHGPRGVITVQARRDSCSLADNLKKLTPSSHDSHATVHRTPGAVSGVSRGSSTEAVLKRLRLVFCEAPCSDCLVNSPLGCLDPPSTLRYSEHTPRNDQRCYGEDSSAAGARSANSDCHEQRACDHRREHRPDGSKPAHA